MMMEERAASDETVVSSVGMAAGACGRWSGDDCHRLD